MRHGKPIMLAVGGALLLASCSTAPADEARSPAAAKELADALAGRVAGPAISCIPNYRSTQMQVIDDWTILYRDGPTIYVQTPRGGCPGIGNGSRTLVTKMYGNNNLCDGQINELVDLRTGMRGAACAFGPFTPYTKQGV